MRITDILGKDIAKAALGRDLFEELVGVLLKDELRQRHPNGKVIGPGITESKDGGRDVVVVVESGTVGVPRATYREALTWDEDGRTWYSCKSGHTWWSTGVAADLQMKTMRKVKGGKEAKVGPKAKRPSRDVLEHVERGGRYVVVTDQPTGDAQRIKFVADLAEAFEFWLRDLEMKVPATLPQQMELIDGNHLAAYLSEHRPRLPAKLREPLRLKDAQGLKSWEQWGSEFGREREKPTFVGDEPRRSIGTAIRSLVGQNRIVRVVGPPGVGKTRAAYESLGALPDPSATVVYTSNPDDGHRAIEDGWLAETRGVVLVIDEVRSSDVMQAARSFRANARASLLVLLGTADADAVDLRVHGVDLLELDRLDDAASHMLIVEELEAGLHPDPRIARVHALAEGFPLFIVLLARALVADRDAFIHGHDETSRWEAAKRVIAGPKRDYGGDHSRWDREAEIMAKCLLVAILTGHVDLSWDELWEQLGDGLRQVLDEPRDWQLVKQADAFCVHRGTLRRQDSSRHYRYVSPNNLVRIILNRFFGPPHDLGPRVARWLPELRERALEVARQVEAFPALRHMARSECVELERRYAEQGSLDELTQWFGSGESLYLAARVLPDEVAKSLTTVLLGWDDDRFEAAKGIRSAARQTLEHLVHRRLDAAVFGAVEAALSRSAKAEFEPWANNATGIWRSLFLPILSQTYRPWEERMALLRAHLADPNPAMRALAIGGLDAAIGVSETGVGHTREDEVDGVWPVPTNDQVRAMKVEAWKLLLSTVADPAEPVATAARKAVTQNLRGAVVAGFLGLADGASDGLVSAVREWSRAQKTALLAEIAEIQAWHALPDQGAFLLAAVEAALAPVTFGEQLSSQVGNHHPGPWPIDVEGRATLEAQRDTELVEAALGSPSLLLDELSWLVSDEAVRRPYFMQQLGLHDRDEVFLPHLEDHALRIGTSTLLVPYIIGRAEAEPMMLDRWLDRHADDPCWDRVVAEVLVWAEVSDQRLERLRAVVRRTPIPARTLVSLAFRLEHSKASPGVLLDLVEDLKATQAMDAGIPLVAHVLARPDLPPAVRERALDLSEVFLREVARSDARTAGSEVAWEAAAMALATHGRVVSAIDATITKLLRHQGSARAERFMRWLLDHGYAEATWAQISAALDDGKGFELQWALGRLALFSAIDPRLVLEWVGMDESKARTVAKMSSLYVEALDPLARGILLRFGPEGPAARELVARVLSAPRVINSLDDFYAQQRSNAQRWSQDPDPRVRQWALGVVAELDRVIAETRLENEARRRHAG